jgi:hypothetical protein
VAWRSPGRAEQFIIDTAKALTATARRLLPRISEALRRRERDWPSDAGSSLFTGESARRSLPGQSTRVALLSAAVVGKTYALRVVSMASIQCSTREDGSVDAYRRP